MADLNTALGRSEYLGKCFRNLHDLERASLRHEIKAEDLATLQIRALLFCGQQLARLADVIEREALICKNHGATVTAPAQSVTGPDSRD